MDEEEFLNDDDLSLLDRLYAPDNAEMNYKYKICIQYLCQLKEPETILNNSRSHRVIRFLKDFSEDNDDLVKCFLEQKTIIEVFVNSLAFYHGELKTFLSAYSKSSHNLHEELEQTYLDHLDFIEELIYLIRNLTNKSKSICYKFHDNFGTQAILEYLDDDSLVRRLLKFKQRSSTTIQETGFHFLLGLLGTLLNISYIADYRKKDFEDLKSTDKVLKFVEYIKTHDDARLLAYVTLTNIVNENEIETLLDTRHAIEDLVGLIRIGVDSIEEKDNLKRIRVDVDYDEDNELLEDVCFINADWNILDLLLALYRLAINDKLKSVIYQDYNIKIELQKLFSFGNDTEKEYGAKLLWQLCFDKSIAKDVQESESLFTYVQNIGERCDCKRKNLRRYCKGIIWSVSKHEQKAQIMEINRNAAENLIRSVLPALNISQDLKPQQINKGRHIMISYNGQSRQDCLKIKVELEKLGHTVWIDVEDISGSSLEAMANAIENSKCVLMCMTEKYKQSPNCRAVSILYNH
jgi:hypothetical protein